MQTSTPISSLSLSPKRKRDASESFIDIEPSPTRLKTTNVASGSLLESEITRSSSPRSSVAGHMQRLDLHETNCMPVLDCTGAPPSRKSVEQDQIFEPDVYFLNQPLAQPYTPPSSSHSYSQHPIYPSTQFPSSNLPLKTPGTPHQRPTTSPTPPPSAKKPEPNMPPTPSPALWWSETEITGHDPDPSDPTDDGEGINGIGFLPTPAIAYARAERRRRQVKEWKEREGREARAKRGEKRRRRDAGELFSAGDIPGKEGSGRKVRFTEV
ncbi:MAG: hypothetical protein Q9217_000256 [Psora testacea]